MKRGRKLRWLIWHPHEKLWNWRLVNIVRRLLGKRVGGQVVGAIVAADSLILAVRVIARRARCPRPAPPRPVLYLDCGLHKTGAQVRCVHDWFAGRHDLRILGFEASGAHYADAVAALADLPEAELHQVALVGPEHEGDTVALYRSGTNGAADSLFSERGNEYDLVPARRLSEIIGGRPLEQMTVILRMNIEGAEQFVIDDLIDAGVRVDGYYGMWDDLSKIDPAADERFRERLRRHGIANVTFNDRDLRHRLRRWAIRFDMETSMRAGARAAAASPASDHRGPVATGP
jgi:hypothetical protein